MKSRKGSRPRFDSFGRKAGDDRDGKRDAQAATVGVVRMKMEVTMREGEKEKRGDRLHPPRDAHS